MSETLDVHKESRVWLRHSHPNFFLIFCVTALFHVLQGTINLFGPPDFFNSPGLVGVNAFADPVIWGVAFSLIGSGLIVGLFLSHFNVARIALAAGAALCLLRSGLIASSIIVDDVYSSITAIPTWFLAGAVHLAQSGEPIINPASIHGKIHESMKQLNSDGGGAASSGG